MTLNSSVLFSYGEVSLTGRVSTSEPGRNARMPLTMTVRPPLTLPLIVPVDELPLSSAFSRLSHAARRFALSRDRMRVAKTVFQRVDGDGNEVAGLDFDLAAVVQEFFEGDVASDLRPALTTTKLGSTRMTSAVITSPMRISWRARLSSKSAAKRFVTGLGCGEDWVEVWANMKNPDFQRWTAEWAVVDHRQAGWVGLTP